MLFLQVMNKFYYFIIFFPLLLVFACTNDRSIKEEIIPSSNASSISNSLIHQGKQVIIFKKEHELLELEKKNNRWVISRKSPIANTFILPIGKFHLFTTPKNESGFIAFPNDLYRRKASITSVDTSFYFQLSTRADSEQGWENKKIIGTSNFSKNNLSTTTVLILPNDPRENGALTACLYCPHWYTEIYAQLYLELGQLQPIFAL